ncbi:MAG: PD-(D/E)XK nuclease superfamily protein [Spirochaetota bacterium]
MKQGTKGNVTGNLLEQTVRLVLQDKGFSLVRYRDWEKKPDSFGNELLLANVPFTTVYGHKGNTEFLLISQEYNIRARIECKWQQSSGSVDEKLPYLYLNCIEAMPEEHVIVLIDGDGFKEGAIRWLKQAVAEQKYITQENQNKLIQVFDLKGFITWANNTFLRRSH